MADLISFPFRLTAAGYVATVEDDTQDAYTEQLATIILTNPGERHLAPSFGLNDPTFDQIDGASLSIQVEMFGPPVTIADVQTRYVTDTRQDVTVFFV